MSIFDYMPAGTSTVPLSTASFEKEDITVLSRVDGKLVLSSVTPEELSEMVKTYKALPLPDGDVRKSSWWDQHKDRLVAVRVGTGTPIIDVGNKLAASLEALNAFVSFYNGSWKQELVPNTILYGNSIKDGTVVKSHFTKAVLREDNWTVEVFGCKIANIPEAKPLKVFNSQYSGTVQNEWKKNHLGFWKVWCGLVLLNGGSLLVKLGSHTRPYVATVLNNFWQSKSPEDSLISVGEAIYNGVIETNINDNIQARMIGNGIDLRDKTKVEVVDGVSVFPVWNKDCQTVDLATIGTNKRFQFRYNGRRLGQLLTYGTHLYKHFIETEIPGTGHPELVSVEL